MLHRYPGQVNPFRYGPYFTGGYKQTLKSGHFILYFESIEAGYKTRNQAFSVSAPATPKRGLYGTAAPPGIARQADCRIHGQTPAIPGDVQTGPGIASRRKHAHRRPLRSVPGLRRPRRRRPSHRSGRPPPSRFREQQYRPHPGPRPPRSRRRAQGTDSPRHRLLTTTGPRSRNG